MIPFLDGNPADGLDLIKSIPNIASAGAVIASVVLFLKAQRETARENREQIVVIVDMLGDRLEAMGKQVAEHTLSERQLAQQIQDLASTIARIRIGVDRDG